MTCYHPHTAFEAIGVKSPDGKKIIRYSNKGMYKVTYSFNPGYQVYRCKDDTYGYDYKAITLPCNNCIGCRIDRARQWSVRNLHEAQMSDSACFLTLTFGDAATIDNVFRLREFKHLSRNKKFEEARKRCNTLVRGDFSRFMKRLREAAKRLYGIDNIRFYAAGEYGDCNERPHYHCLIYNFDFPDKQYLATEKGNVYYTSKLLEEAWGYGFVYISDFSINTANYVSRYVTKKINGQLKDAWYQGKEPEYQVCSNRPGIGRKWFEKYKNDVFPTDEVVYSTKQGKKVKIKPPKYYDKLYDKFCPDEFEEVKKRRELYISSMSNKEKWIEENSRPRLDVKEECMRLRVKKLIRVYERSTFNGVNLDDILKKCNEYGIPYDLLTARGSPP